MVSVFFFFFEENTRLKSTCFQRDESLLETVMKIRTFDENVWDIICNFRKRSHRADAIQIKIRYAKIRETPLFRHIIIFTRTLTVFRVSYKI